MQTTQQYLLSSPATRQTHVVVVPHGAQWPRKNTTHQNMPLHSWRTLTRGVSARPRRREAREQLFILWESGRKRGAGVRACEERKWPGGGGNTLTASGGLWGGNEDVWGERSRVWVNRTEITFICKCAIYKYRFEVEEWRASSSAEVPVYKMSTGLSTLLLGSKEMWDMRRAVKLLNQSTGSNVSKGAPPRCDTRPRGRVRFQEPAAGHWGREIPSMMVNVVQFESWKRDTWKLLKDIWWIYG